MGQEQTSANCPCSLTVLMVPVDTLSMDPSPRYGENASMLTSTVSTGSD